MPLHNLLLFVGILVVEMSTILIVARIGGKSLVTQVAQPYERLTCEMTPTEMLDSHTQYGMRDIDAVDVAQDELEATGSIFERNEVEALLALATRARLEAR